MKANICIGMCACGVLVKYKKTKSKYKIELDAAVAGPTDSL